MSETITAKGEDGKGVVQFTCKELDSGGFGTIYEVISYTGAIRNHAGTTQLVVKTCHDEKEAAEEASWYVKLNLVVDAEDGTSHKMRTFKATHGIDFLGVGVLYTVLPLVSMLSSVLVLPRYGADGFSMTFTNATLRVLAADMTNALRYMHSRNICHSDVKLDNMCACKDRFVLIDFGMAQQVPPQAHPIPTYNEKYTNNSKLHTESAQLSAYYSCDVSRGYGVSPRSDFESLVYALLKAATSSTNPAHRKLEYNNGWERKRQMWRSPSGIGLQQELADLAADNLIDTRVELCKKKREGKSGTGLFAEALWLKPFIAEVLHTYYMKEIRYDTLLRFARSSDPSDLVVLQPTQTEMFRHLPSVVQSIYRELRGDEYQELKETPAVMQDIREYAAAMTSVLHTASMQNVNDPVNVLWQLWESNQQDRCIEMMRGFFAEDADARKVAQTILCDAIVAHNKINIRKREREEACSF